MYLGWLIVVRGWSFSRGPGDNQQDSEMYIANRDKLDVRNEMPGTETSSGAGED